MISILTVLVITACGMWGGQTSKWVRRYLLPSVIALYIASKKEKKKWKATFYLPLMGILSMGYGENSGLRRFLWNNDKLTRIVDGILVSIPFLLCGKWWACIALPIAWSIRAGGFDITKNKQFLWEDFFRYGTIGLLVVI